MSNSSRRAVTAEQLQAAYHSLFPKEKPQQLCVIPHEAMTADNCRIYGNWLETYQKNPERGLSIYRPTCWYGKVTNALLAALGIKMPRTKGEMLKALSA